MKKKAKRNKNGTKGSLEKEVRTQGELYLLRLAVVIIQEQLNFIESSPLWLEYNKKRAKAQLVPKGLHNLCNLDSVKDPSKLRRV